MSGPKGKQNPLYTSKTLSDLWQDQGHCLIGDVTFESAAYVARYITKKITGALAEDHYRGRHPEYITMSRRPGIGSGWYQKFKNDVFPGGFIVVRGHKMSVPKFYDTQYLLTNPQQMEQIKLDREHFANSHAKDNTYDRLKQREIVQLAKAQRLLRNL